MSADRDLIFDERLVSPDASEFHVLLDVPDRGAHLIVRHGVVGGEMDFQINGFRSFSLIDDEQHRLKPPPDMCLKPVPRWSRVYGSMHENLAERVRHLRFQTLDAPRLMHWLEELEVLVVPTEQISQAVYVSGLYEPCTASVLRSLLHDGGTFVDVGANVGLFTMLASRWVGPAGSVFALEPSRRECARLRAHVAHNALSNVHVIQAAAGNHYGTAVLQVADARHAGLNTLDERFIYSTITKAYTEVVPVLQIDALVQSHGIPRVDVIKIDVEGTEHDVVAGAQNTIDRDFPALVLEVAGTALECRHPGRVRTEAFLSSRGYAFVAIDGDSGVLRSTGGLTGPSENFLVARPELLATALSSQASDR